MPTWPQTIPQDLKHELEALEGFRNPDSHQDRWGAIREWLEDLGIEAQPGLPAAPEMPAADPGHSTPARNQGGRS